MSDWIAVAALLIFTVPLLVFMMVVNVLDWRRERRDEEPR